MRVQMHIFKEMELKITRPLHCAFGGKLKKRFFPQAYLQLETLFPSAGHSTDINGHTWELCPYFKIQQ
jgi:hypothetical protein